MNVGCGTCEAWPPREGLVDVPSCDGSIREISEGVTSIRLKVQAGHATLYRPDVTVVYADGVPVEARGMVSTIVKEMASDSSEVASKCIIADLSNLAW